MSAFSDAFAQDLGAEVFNGDFAEDAVRQKADGASATLTVATEFLSERVEDGDDNQEWIVTTIRVMAPIEHSPDQREAWIIAGKRYAVTTTTEKVNDAFVTFEAESREQYRIRRRGSISG